MAKARAISHSPVSAKSSVSVRSKTTPKMVEEGEGVRVKVAVEAEAEVRIWKRRRGVGRAFGGVFWVGSGRGRGCRLGGSFVAVVVGFVVGNLRCGWS